MITSTILFVVLIIIFMLVSEIFTVLFRMTGLPADKAKFQVISLLTTSGFTSKESELILNMRVRRRLAIITMMFGYTFTATFVSALVHVFLNIKEADIYKHWWLIPLVVGTLIVVAILSRIKKLQDAFDKQIKKIGHKFLHNMSVNRISVVDTYGRDCIAEVYLNIVPDLLCEKTLEESKIKQEEGIQVLTTLRDSKVLTNIGKDHKFNRDDIIVVYGNITKIKKVFTADFEVGKQVKKKKRNKSRHKKTNKEEN